MTLWPLVAAAALLVVAGCGSGADGGSSSSAAGEQTRSAGQINTDALNALAKEPSIHLSITGTDTAGVVSTIEADITADGARVLSTDPSGVATTLVVVGGRSYAKEPGGFVELPAEVNTTLQALTRDKQVACTRVEHGTLTKGPITRLNGHRVITLIDDGKYPGDTPGRALVALDGPPLLLRTTTSGMETPGGSAACGHTGASTTVKQQIDYDYSRGVTVTAPPVAPLQSA